MVRKRMSSVLYATLLLSPYAAVPAYAQLGTYPYPTTNGTTSNSGNRGIATAPTTRSMGNDFPSYDPNLSHRQMVARREEMHRRMVENSARLLNLTRELQEDLHLREATDADAKRLDDIAKLARAVRDQMKQ